MLLYHSSLFHQISLICLSSEHTQRNIFIECSCHPSERRLRHGMEGVIYKTTPMVGTVISFEQTITFVPLSSLDGMLTIDIRNKPTFESVSSVGSFSIPIALLQSSKVTSVDIENESNETITVVYSTETVQLA